MRAVELCAEVRAFAQREERSCQRARDRDGAPPTRERASAVSVIETRARAPGGPSGQTARMVYVCAHEAAVHAIESLICAP